MKPLSSKKTTWLPLREAPFLSAAIPAFATVPWPRRSLRGLVVRASGMSNPGRGAFAQRSPGGNSRGIAGPPPRQSGDTSKSRWNSRPFSVRQENFHELVFLRWAQTGFGPRMWFRLQGLQASFLHSLPPPFGRRQRNAKNLDHLADISAVQEHLSCQHSAGFQFCWASFRPHTMMYAYSPYTVH